MHLLMRGIHIFEKQCYREIRAMRGRAMRGPPVHSLNMLDCNRKKLLVFFSSNNQSFFEQKLNYVAVLNGNFQMEISKTYDKSHYIVHT